MSFGFCTAFRVSKVSQAEQSWILTTVDRTWSFKLQAKLLWNTGSKYARALSVFFCILPNTMIQLMFDNEARICMQRIFMAWNCSEWLSPDLKCRHIYYYTSCFAMPTVVFTWYLFVWNWKRPFYCSITGVYYVRVFRWRLCIL